MSCDLPNEAILALLAKADNESIRAWLTQTAQTMLTHHEQQVQFWSQIITKLSANAVVSAKVVLSAEETATLSAMSHISRPGAPRSRAGSSAKLPGLSGQYPKFESSNTGSPAQTAPSASSQSTPSSTTPPQPPAESAKSQDISTSSNASFSSDSGSSASNVVRKPGMQPTFAAMNNDDLKRRLQNVLHRARPAENENSSEATQSASTANISSEPASTTPAEVAAAEPVINRANDDHLESSVANMSSLPSSASQSFDASHLVESKQIADSASTPVPSSSTPQPPPLPFTPNNMALPAIPSPQPSPGPSSPLAMPPTAALPSINRSPSAPPPLPACPPPLPPTPTPVANSQSMPPPLPPSMSTPHTSESSSEAPAQGHAPSLSVTSNTELGVDAAPSTSASMTAAAGSSSSTSEEPSASGRYKPVGAKTLLPGALAAAGGPTSELLAKLQRRRID